MWAERDMPVLRAIRERFDEEKPLAGMRMSACLHVTAETANLARTLKAGGADLVLVRVQPAVDPGRRRRQPGAGLRHPRLRHQGRGRAQLLPAHRRRPGAPAARHDGRRRRPGQRHDLHRPRPARRRPRRGPHLGRRSSAPPTARRWSANVVASMEETTTGVIRLRAMEKDGVLKLPVIAVNDAQTKHFFDNRYGTGQSTIDGVIRATDMLLAGRKVVVCGYGWCGKGVALRARGMGSHVIVTEVDPIRALEAAMDGFQVMPIAEAAKLGDLFITVTGNIHVIRGEHFAAMKDGAMICNSGHFNVELALDDLAKLAVDDQQERPRVRRRVRPQERPPALRPGRGPADQPGRRPRPPGQRHGHELRRPGPGHRVVGQEQGQARAQGPPGAQGRRRVRRLAQAPDHGHRHRHA